MGNFLGDSVSAAAAAAAAATRCLFLLLLPISPLWFTNYALVPTTVEHGKVDPFGNLVDWSTKAY